MTGHVSINDRTLTSSERGGNSLNGCQSTIDKPDLVSLVMPPTQTVMNVSPEHVSSQIPIDLRAVGDSSVKTAFMFFRSVFNLICLIWV